MCSKRQKTKTKNAEAFNMITNKDEAKAIAKHISCDCKCKFNSITCNSNQKWNNKTCQCESKNYGQCEKKYSWNSSKCIGKSSKYLKSVADTSGTKCDKIVMVMDIVQQKREIL